MVAGPEKYRKSEDVDARLERIEQLQQYDAGKAIS